MSSLGIPSLLHLLQSLKQASIALGDFGRSLSLLKGLRYRAYNKVLRPLTGNIDTLKAKYSRAERDTY